MAIVGLMVDIQEKPPKKAGDEESGLGGGSNGGGGEHTLGMTRSSSVYAKMSSLGSASLASLASAPCRAFLECELVAVEFKFKSWLETTQVCGVAVSAFRTRTPS